MVRVITWEQPVLQLRDEDVCHSLSLAARGGNGDWKHGGCCENKLGGEENEW